MYSTRFVCRLLLMLLAVILPGLAAAQNFNISGGGTNQLSATISANIATGGTITITDSGTYTETQDIPVAPRNSAQGRRAFNIIASPGQHPTIVLNGGGFLAYAGAADAKIGSNSGGRIVIDARNGAIPGSPSTGFWYIGQENGLPSGTACHLTLENLQINAIGLDTLFVFGAGGNDGTPQTTGAMLTMRNVSTQGARTVISALYGPSTYASTINIENSQLYDFGGNTGDAYAVHVGAFGILAPNSALNVTRSVLHTVNGATGGGETNVITVRAGNLTMDHSDVLTEAGGVSRAITLVGAATASITNSILRGDAGTVNFGTGSATSTYNNVTATAVPNSGFTASNSIGEWPVYVTYGINSGSDNFRVQPAAQSTTHGPSPPLGSVGAGALPTPVVTPTPTPTPPPTMQQNGYVSAGILANTIVSLRFDATGQGNYGMEAIAAGGSVRNVQSVSLSGATMTITPQSNNLLWDIPFVRPGYYDADRDLNYPNATNTLGATALSLPFRQFVGSSGNVTRIEHFKRLPDGTYFQWLNLQNGNRLLMQSGASQNWDVELHVPGVTNVTYQSQDDRLTLNAGTLSGAVSLRVLPRGERDSPQAALLMPNVEASPALPVNFYPTGKTLDFGQAMTEFMQQGMYWSPDVTSGGEWVNGAVETLMHADPRTWYRIELRKRMLAYLGNLGYDRFGHFGHLFAWGRYPDYGSPGLLNVPPGNAPWDMRILLMNAMWIQSVHQYVLATGDTDFLQAKRARYVMTNGSQPQPICGNQNGYDYVLPAGDMRLDGAPATTRHTLGQTFTATASFSSVSVLVGNPSLSAVASGRMRLLTAPGGTVIAQTDFTIPVNTSTQRTLSIGSTRAAGSYYIEVSDNDSGVSYFGPGIIWWGDPDSSYAGGDAYVGPVKANVSSMLEAMFTYVRDNMGGAASNLAYYINDPQFNVPNHKSARHQVGTTTTYWEPAGGGYDALTGLWYNAACTAMQQLSTLAGDDVAAQAYAGMRTAADTAYRNRYWRNFTENGRTTGRFLNNVDWDNVVRDLGFTYYNLEALVRGITTQEQSRSIYKWLDRGQFRPTTTLSNWQNNIYGIWEIAPPFNTITTSNYYNVTGTLPWMQVVSNGGSRLEIAARDLQGRSRNFPIDNMHERNSRVLGRYISPDRLTGGRTYPDPGGRGRWQFLGPNSNLLDFEGFREIFPFGSVATMQPDFYLDFVYRAEGLQIRPRVPGNLDSIRFNNIGYWRAMFDFTAAAQRTTVLEQLTAPQDYAAPATGGVAQSFIAPQAFSKAGVRVRVTPFNAKVENGLSLALERANGSDWDEVASTWLSNVEDNAWVWISADQTLQAGTYRIRVSEVRPAAGETISFAHNPADVLGGGSAMLTDGAPGSITGDLALRVVMERTQLSIESVYDPQAIGFILEPMQHTTLTTLPGGLRRLTTLVEPGETRLLVPSSQQAAAQGWTLLD
jgi:hypothetical protein